MLDGGTCGDAADAPARLAPPVPAEPLDGATARALAEEDGRLRAALRAWIDAECAAVERGGGHREPAYTQVVERLGASRFERARLAAAEPSGVGWWSVFDFE